MDRSIRTTEDVLALLDRLFPPESDRWLVHDSGCFHHLPPHRRLSHLALLERVLAPGGHFTLTCFAEGAMGSELADDDFYRQARLHGGLAYSAVSLRGIFSGLELLEIRRMRELPPEDEAFGVPFLWTAVFRRPVAPGIPGIPAACTPEHR